MEGRERAIRLRRWLWLALVLALPVPIVILGPGHVPPARLLMLGSVASSVLVFEQSTGAVPLLALILMLQGLVYVGLFWLLAALILRLLQAAAPGALAAITALLIFTLLTIASVSSIYYDPYQPHSARTDLLHVYQ